MTPTELREAKEFFTDKPEEIKRAKAGEYEHNLNILLDLADHFLSAQKELGERKLGAKDVVKDCIEHCYADGFNSCHDIATQVVVRKDMEIADVPARLVINQIIRYLRSKE